MIEQMRNKFREAFEAKMKVAIERAVQVAIEDENVTSVDTERNTSDSIIGMVPKFETTVAIDRIQNTDTEVKVSNFNTKPRL